MIKKCNIGTANIAYRIFGQGPIEIVIEGSINSCNAEWWDFCSKIDNHSILVYDRAGYGRSSISTMNRTPENIVKELSVLLENLEVNSKIVLVGHSQGGLYASLFAINNPEKIKGLILLDPLSYADNDFKRLLSEEEYKVSGVDKYSSLKYGEIVTKLKLGFLIKGLLKKSPPFYYHSFSKEAEQYILGSLIKHSQYSTALSEYKLSHVDANLEQLKRNKFNFSLVLITHSSKKMCEEIVYFGNTTREIALKVETIWQNIMKKMLTISSNSKSYVADNSCHYIHLTDESMVIKRIMEIV